MKLIILHIALFIAGMTCSQNTKENVLSEDQLINKTITLLDIDKLKTEYILSRVSPSNSKETIIVIGVVADEDESSYGLDSHIVIVNNETGKITHTFFENSKENGWISNAEFIYDIAIDTLNYKLNASENAFGVAAKFRTMSQPNPYYSESLSLFTKEGNSLKKVLDSYTVYESFGEVNVNSCYSNIKNTIKELTLSDLKTNGYNDMLVTSNVFKINHYEDQNGDCNPNKTHYSTTKSLLKFDGKTYQVNNLSKIKPATRKN